MDEVLPISGWTVCEVDFNSKGCIVKYKHVDMSYLRCPCCGDSDLEAIVIDEKYLGEGLKFITMVTNKTGELLYIGKGKGEDSLKTFFDLLTAAQKQAIKVVGADRSNSYSTAVRKCLPNAEICTFVSTSSRTPMMPVAKVRRKEFNEKSKEENGKTAAREMKSSRYILQRNSEDLAGKERERLERLHSFNENINKTYILKEELRNLYTR